jgi:hypothetical protein
MKHKLLASKFIEWYYDNHEDVKMLGTSMMHLLKRTGQCSLSVEEVFDCCGYIPKYICEDNDGIDQYTIEYNTEDVELINDFKY